MNSTTAPENTVETTQETTQETVAFLLLPDFSIMSVVAYVEPLRAANRYLEREVYQWRFLSLDGGPVTSSNGIPIETDAMPQSGYFADQFYICAGLKLAAENPTRMRACLNRIDRMRTKIGAISGGTFALAEAGLIGDRSCTLHWEYLPTFREEFPDIAVQESLFVIDRGLHTSSGGLASTDLALELIARVHGETCARAVANQFNLDRKRTADEYQRDGTQVRSAVYPASMKAVIEVMLANCEEQISMEAICDAAGYHPRQVQRQFRQWAGCSPTVYYRRIRLEKAMGLIRHSSLPILEIATLTGFSTASHFSRLFKEFFGKSPMSIRRAEIGREDDTLSRSAANAPPDSAPQSTG